MTDLIAKRNQKFTDAINELLLACASHTPPLDPIELLREATEDHLPVLPGIVDGIDGDTEGGEGGGRGRKKGRKERKEEMEFFERFPSERLSVERILEDLAEEEWWKDQIVPGGRKTVEAREAKFGSFLPFVLSSIFVLTDVACVQGSWIFRCRLRWLVRCIRRVGSARYTNIKQKRSTFSTLTFSLLLILHSLAPLSHPSPIQRTKPTTKKKRSQSHQRIENQ